MADPVAHHSCGSDRRLRPLRSQVAARPQWVQPGWTGVRNCRLRVHDLRGVAGGAQEGSRLAAGSRPVVDARALMAPISEPAANSISLMVLLILVVGSGVFGAVLQNYMPNVIRVEVPLETVFEQIDRVRGRLLEEADEFVASASVASGSPLIITTQERGGVIADELPAISEADVMPLQKFYTREMRPFLEHPGARGHALSESANARAMFQGLRTLLPPALHETVKYLEDICEEERQLRQQVRLHHWLHGWLLFHIPLSLALLLLGAVHAIVALRY